MLLGEVYRSITAVVTGVEATDLRRPTRTKEWSVQDLLFHLLLDAQRALVALASPTDDRPDVDRVTYWLPFRPDNGDGGAASARFARIGSSAYADPAQLVEHWRETSEAAQRAVVAADPGLRVRTQGHVLTVADLVHTLVVEATIHHLDLTLHLPGPPPPDAALRACREVLDGLLGGPVAADWTDSEYLLKGTGRLPLTHADRAALSDQAARLPLLG